MSKPKVKVVIGANYGDEGKGLATDYFTQQAKGPVLNVLYRGWRNAADFRRARQLRLGPGDRVLQLDRLCP